MKSKRNNSKLLPLPDNWQPDTMSTIALCLPSDPQWQGILYEQMALLGNQSRWARDITGEGAKTVAKVWRDLYFLNRIEGGCLAQSDTGAIFYESADDIDGFRDALPTTTITGDVVRDGLLTRIGLGGEIVYEAVSSPVELWFDNSEPTMNARVTVNNVDTEVIDITGDGGFKKKLINFDTEPPNIIKVEAVADAGFQAQSAENPLSVVRRDISIVTDESMYRLRQSPTDAKILEQSWDGGKHWSEAFNYVTTQSGEGGGIVQTTEEFDKYLETVNNIFNSTSNVTNNNISSWTEFDGTIDDETKRKALCLTIEVVINGMIEAMHKARAEQYNDVRSFVAGLLSFAQTAFSFASALASVGTGGATLVARYATASYAAGVAEELFLGFFDEATYEERLDNLTFISEKMPDALCRIGDNIVYPLTQSALQQAFLEGAGEFTPYNFGNLGHLLLVRMGQQFSSREFFYQFVNLWGEIAKRAISLDIDLGNACACWTRVCKHPDPYTITVISAQGNEQEMRAPVLSDGILTAGVMRAPVTGGYIWRLKANFMLEFDEPITNAITLYVPVIETEGNTRTFSLTLNGVGGITRNDPQVTAWGSPLDVIQLQFPNVTGEVNRLTVGMGVNGVPEGQAYTRPLKVNVGGIVICASYPA